MPYKDVVIGKYSFRHSPDRTVVSALEGGSTDELTNVDKIWRAHRGTDRELRGLWYRCCNFDKCSNLVYTSRGTSNRRSRVSCSKECGYAKVDSSNLKEKISTYQGGPNTQTVLDYLEIKILKSKYLELPDLIKELQGELPRQIQSRVLGSIPVKFGVTTLTEAKRRYLEGKVPILEDLKGRTLDERKTNPR